MQFSELNLEDSVLDALDAMNFRECTPVQEHTIPVILEGKDLIGVALSVSAPCTQPAQQGKLSGRCHQLYHYGSYA